MIFKIFIDSKDQRTILIYFLFCKKNENIKYKNFGAIDNQSVGEIPPPRWSYSLGTQQEKRNSKNSSGASWMKLGSVYIT